MAARILIVDDERELRIAFKRMLEKEGFETDVAESASEALELISQASFDLLLTDISMPGMDGLQLLGALREQKDLTPAVVISGVGTVDHALRAVRLGALDFVEKPLHAERLIMTVRNALRYTTLADAHDRLQADMGVGRQLIGEGPAMARLKRLISKVAPSNGRVLITGENGTGKELVAAAIHAGSVRSQAPFVKLNCGAVPENLVESELFGHEKGAFTGAASARKGRFELADTGTLFLDEVGDMPLPMQVKLLRVLQEGQFERVGGSRTMTVDVRVLAATNQDLPGMVQEGRFREDLYYRLNVVSVHVPPLRERAPDIPALVRNFAHGMRLDITSAGFAALQRYSYPGNVRELQNLVERLSILYGGERVDEEQIESILPAGDPRRHSPTGLYRKGESLRDLLKNAERQIITEAIAAHGSSKTAAAQALQTERSHFYKKCRQLGIGDDEG
ncbi:MAG: sigma-54 dependent transcriptional regulator [Myxococcales bacterium]|nr:sigma-54 dependent transcriptional regulator [Myxococcales bacterium]MDD9968323.1 sigma-54 dependent transcriptional regulator [Myxococcales bacterium]